MPNNRLFVYGTLRSNAGGPVDLRLIGELIGEAHVAGELRLVTPSYPGLIDGDGQVIGELWRLRETATFEWLDNYEGPQYERENRSVYHRGRKLRAWLYMFRGDVEGTQVIRSGDWLAR